MVVVALTCREQNVLNGLLEHVHSREHQINDLCKQRNSFQPAGPRKELFSDRYLHCTSSAHPNGRRIGPFNTGCRRYTGKIVVTATPIASKTTQYPSPVHASEPTPWPTIHIHAPRANSPMEAAMAP